MKNVIYRTIIFVSALAIAAIALAATRAKDLLHASGVDGGLVVFIGIQDPHLLTFALWTSIGTESIRPGNSFRRRALTAARQRIRLTASTSLT